jgi:ABC-type enterochelin transport system ATPase subunit
MPAPNYAANLDDTQAIIAGNGAGESTVEGQLSRAIANLTGKQGLDSKEAAALTAAITILQAKQAHIHDPKNH